MKLENGKENPKWVKHFKNTQLIANDVELESQEQVRAYVRACVCSCG